MPIYEYECRVCDHTLDALQKIDEDPLVYCPSCGEPGLKRLISAPRFRLKGEGWYETDFKQGNQRNLAKSDTEAPESAKADAKADQGAGSEGNGKAEKPGSPKKSSGTMSGGKVDSD